MISKVQKCKPQNDNYGRLANYIADASHKGEKSLMHWCAGCADDEDYAFAIQEVKDTQAMNARSTKEKTYHLIVSFRPEDEAKLTPETYKAIEERFAHALGFEKHQRHCGVHKNTGNLHMHIAYNMIHPEKFNRHEPYRDFHKRDQVCREIERDFGLSVDKGRGEKGTQLEAGAALIEAHTGQQSFESYAKEYKNSILQSLTAATSWDDVHKTFANYGMELVPHGNGLVVRDRHNPKKAKHALKASAFDRNFSMKKLEKRFGKYERAEHALDKAWPELCHYNPEKPLHRAPERGQLFTEYRQGITERKDTLTELHAVYSLIRSNITKKWEEKTQLVKQSGLNYAAQRRLMGLIKIKKAKSFLEAKKDMYSKKEEITAKIPYNSWITFLQRKAELGNETALAILRSRHDQVKEDNWTKQKSWLEHLEPHQQAIPQSSMPEELLQAVKIMQKISPTAKLFIDKKGTLIFTMEDGATMRDTGKALFFSEQMAEQALLYAQKKWERDVVLGRSGVILREEAVNRTKEKDIQANEVQLAQLS